MSRLTFASVSETLSVDQLVLTRINEKSAKYAVSFNGERLFTGRTLDEVMQLFSDYQGRVSTEQLQVDEAAIQLDTEKRAVLSMEPTQTSFQEIAAIFDANGWGMTPDQEIEFHEKHWLVLPEIEPEINLYPNDEFCYGRSTVDPASFWISLCVVASSGAVMARASNWRSFVAFAASRWTEEYREEMINCDEPQETDDREFDESIFFNQSCDLDGFCTVASLPLLAEDIQTHPATDLLAFIAACKAIAKAFKRFDAEKILYPSDFSDMVATRKKIKVCKGFGK
jgi:hypothetical protein